MPDSSSNSGGENLSSSAATTPGAGPPAPDPIASGPGPSASGPAPLPLPRPKFVRWIVICIAAVVAASLWSWRGNVTGPKDVDAPITLITSDREDLACALNRAVGKYRCEFRGPGQVWPDAPAAKERLAPYFTTDRQLYLLPGLFEQPALADRYRTEPPRGLPRDHLRRFVARCKLHLIEKVDGLQTRWLAGSTFGPSDGAWVAEPRDCKVTND